MIGYKKITAATVPNAAIGKVITFVDENGLPKYKDENGVVGSNVGPQGPIGNTGPQPALSSSTPTALTISGTGSAGSSSTAPKSDHTHPMPGLSTTSVAGFMSATNTLKLGSLITDVVADYGADPTGSTDSTTAIQNAINAVQSAGGGVVWLPKGRFKITSTLVVSGQGVTLWGAGASYNCDVGNYTTTGVSWIVWGASSSNIAVQAAPVAGASNQALIGFQFRGISIDCRNGDTNQATIALQMLSCHGFHVEDFFIIDPITVGIDMNVVATLGEARDCTRGFMGRGAIRVLDGASSGAFGLRLNGDSGANTCCNHFDTVQIVHSGSNGNAAIELLNADSNTFINCYVNRGSGTNVGIRFNGSNSAATLVARNNVLINCSPGLGGIVSKATGLTFPALDNYAVLQQVGNGEPVPTIEAGSSFYFSCNGTQNGGAFSTLLGNIPAFKLNSNFTTTIATNTNTGLQFFAQPNEVWKLSVNMSTQCSSTGGSKYQITAPAGATVEGWLKSSGAAITTLSYQRITAINTLNATATHTVATTPGPDTIEVMVSVGATGGVIAIGAASVTATQTTTIFAGSYMTAQKVSGV